MTIVWCKSFQLRLFNFSYMYFNVHRVKKQYWLAQLLQHRFGIYRVIDFVFYIPAQAPDGHQRIG